jgi:GDP-4-dehydro-6-deoxy-D-mannose reductase
VIGTALAAETAAGLAIRALDVRDGPAVLREFRAARPDAVLDLAGVAFVPRALDEPRLAFDVNAGGALNALLAARDAARGARFVFVSSAHVYGRVTDAGAMPLAESRPLAPVTLYGASKAAAEFLCAAYAEAGLDVVVLRPFNQIGPGQDEAYAVSSFARQVARLERAADGAPLRHGNLDVVRDFLDVREAAVAYERVLAAPAGALPSGAAFNLCSGRGTPLRAVVEGLLARARRTIATELDAARLRSDEVPVFVGDPARLRAAVGFAATTPLEQTLADVLEDARRAVTSS